METFPNYLSQIENKLHREKIEEIFKWIIKKYPELKPKIAWNQPMFTHHETFIIGFSISKNHIAITPEKAGITYFSKDIIASGYEHTMMLMKIKWESPVDYNLLEKMINYNIIDKEKCTTFWRK